MVVIRPLGIRISIDPVSEQNPVFLAKVRTGFNLRA
jgi:hypothetical protein